ncbi:MAG: general secretion pathway protein GspB [Rhodoferax sp.]|nr:general secretion pathway protein GspB [Rhodoferax sp.]
MSYILDALKRADAERERGAAPGLHTRHQLPAGAAAGQRRSVWMAAAAGLLLAALPIAFWFWRTSDAPLIVALTPAASPMPNMVTSAPIRPIAPIAPVPVVVTKAQPAEKSSPIAATSPPTIPTTPASKAVSASTTSQTITLLTELPTELRGQIPKITITGSVYSERPSQRLLLVNNLVLSENSQVASELRLEQIQPRSSVFNYKGTRFRVMH